MSLISVEASLYLWAVVTLAAWAMVAKLYSEGHRWW